MGLRKFDTIAMLSKDLKRGGAGHDGMPVFNLPPEIEAIKIEREKARRNKNWKQADSLRSSLLGKGYGVRDSEDGSVVLWLAEQIPNRPRVLRVPSPYRREERYGRSL